MNKKGLTLTEMLAVLVILGMISLIAYPKITNSLKTYRSDLYTSQVESIKGAAESYVADHIDSIECSEEGTKNEITLLELQNNGYIDENIKNPNTGEFFSTSSKVNVTCKKVNDNYKYTYDFNEA